MPVRPVIFSIRNHVGNTCNRQHAIRSRISETIASAATGAKLVYIFDCSPQ